MRRGARLALYGGIVVAVVGLLGRAGKQVQLPGHVTATSSGTTLLFTRTDG